MIQYVLKSNTKHSDMSTKTNTKKIHLISIHIGPLIWEGQAWFKVTFSNFMMKKWSHIQIELLNDDYMQVRENKHKKKISSKLSNNGFSIFLIILISKINILTEAIFPENVNNDNINNKIW